MAARGVGGGVAVERVFIGAGCNRIVNNVSWSPSGLVAFGAQNAVAIFSPESAQILATLPGHKAVVNCTQWLPTNKDAIKVQDMERHYLLSGSADGVIMIWEIHPKKREWSHMLQVPEMHKRGVTCLTGMMISDVTAIFASTSSDGVVLIWKIVFSSTVGGKCNVSCLDSLSVGSKPMVALSVAALPGNKSHAILAMGGLDLKVHIYFGDQTGKFTHACELKGHADWIRSLDFSLPVILDSEKHNLFLVSSSQDKTIRIWKMAAHALSSGSPIQSRKEDIGLTSYIEGPIFVAGSSSYQVSLESLLVGHEDWVYSVEWQPPSLINGTNCHQPMSILSASMDKTMMIWRPEKTTGIWLNVVTVGELSHSALGFYGGHWAPDGQSILAHGYGGSFHLWRNAGLDYENWQPQKVPSGHFASVSDLTWAKSGKYLLSVSHDQTARVFAPWRIEETSGDKVSWHEIARPQVHGHDINCVTFIQGAGNHRFVSGADEKVARVFEAPLSFLKTLHHAMSQNNFYDFHEQVQVLGANMSALGLSQKPIYMHTVNESPASLHNDGADSLETIPDAVPTVLTEPPVEEQLAWHTLWPETHKLYGHGNELFSLCCDHEGKLIASSCKAQTATVAEIWLWEVGSWKAIGRLHSHSLTVTQLEFSHDDAFLLAVSRDRQFSVFSISKTGDEVIHQLIAKQEAHKRIIWACSWNPFSHDFATGSRDKTVKVWSVNKEASSVDLLATLPQFRDSVTALSWVGRDQSCNAGFLAIGMDNGLIELWSLSGGRVAEINDMGTSPFTAVCAIRFDPLLCHVSTVHRLRWRNPDFGDTKTLQLASCGADQCVRVFEVSGQ
ncbi:elongator complex protein 2 [Ananas comosus]|uniref:Elongator complex protein 2 n=1 Tax=Ananas comosus TaxID=4615 RepID=A0A6P5ENM3_ANACO|nr:elongator complex protein 2 [Ananas comosus]XP_020082936.1 elongator complex protein 2 [Ananas comosus]XP_020082937.1 elongator complex protein 2 [Ananas comosus]XP_020082938.1 elongator complex protein 2 [Ananas comosus]XP_020082940.1 elongator complex protein 2 [Ananas comosus]XP_020082941.1 elongator complex protein 2 [Ananas comosus]XP_020082942.1 elongator complex protein 2 [Ananas comosus]